MPAAPTQRLRLVVLVSGSGTNLQALLDACADPAYPGRDRGGRRRPPGRPRARARRARPASPRSSCGSGDFAERDDVGRGLHRGDGGARARPRGVGRLHEARRRRLPRSASPAATSTRTRRCCRRSPGMHGAADALAYGVKVTGCTLFVVDAGVDTGPILAQRAVEVRRRRRRRVAARAHQGRRARAPRRRRGPHGPRRLDRHRQEGQHPVSTRPVRRALVSVYDKTGLDELARGLADAGVEIVSTGSTAARIAGLGIARHAGAGPHRLPRVPRRPREDPAPEGARGDPRRPPARGPPAPARRARHRAVRARGGQPLPVRRHGRLGRGPGRVRRADRHRRPHDGAGRGQEPPERRGRRLAVALRRRARRGARGRLHARAAAGARGRRRSCTPPSYDVAVASWLGNVVAPTDGGTGLPGVDRRDVAARRGAALRREPAPARRALRHQQHAATRGSRRPSSSTARRCPTTTTSTPTRRGGRRTTTTSPQSRSSSTPTPAASRSAPTSPRRTARPTTPTPSRRSAA